MGKLVIGASWHLTVGKAMRIYVDPFTLDTVAEFEDGSVDRMSFREWYEQMSEVQSR